MLNIQNKRLLFLELSAIVLLIFVRAVGWFPLPAWPFLIFIAIGFKLKPWQVFDDAKSNSALSPMMVLTAVVIGVGYQFFTIFVEGPFLAWLFGEPETPPDVAWLIGNLPGTLGFLLLIIVFSIGEEVAFRGYLLQRLSQWTNHSLLGITLALGLSSIAFGLSHTWQNWPGMVGTMVSGMVFGAMYLVAKRDVRSPIVTHLAVNVTALILAFFGLFVS